MNPLDPNPDAGGASSPDSQTELRELCNRLLDREFTAQDRARLEALVLGDPALRRLYVEIMHQHASLRQSATRLGDVPLAEVLKTLPGEPISKVIRFPSWPLQIAAAVALGVAIWLFVPRPAEKPLATLVETNGARWDNSSLPTTQRRCSGAKATAAYTPS